MEELLKSCAPSQFGGFPGVGLDRPAVVVKAHFSYLVASGQNGGAVFVDRKAAYYAVIRDALLATRCAQTTPEQLRKRAVALFPLAADQETYVQHMSNGGIVRALRLPEPLVRYLQAQLGSTWFAMQLPIQEAYVAESGTAPGAPIADLLYSFLSSRFLTQVETKLQEKGLLVRLVQTGAMWHADLGG